MSKHFQALGGWGHLLQNLVLVCALVCVPFAPLERAHAFAGEVTLPGTVTPAIQGATLLGATDARRRLDLAIILSTQHALQLQTLLKALADPAGRDYQRWLTSAQFQARFGLTHAQLMQVKRFLSGSGMLIGRLQGPFVLDVSSTVKQAEMAFHIQINDYRDAAGQTFFATPGEAHIPGVLAGLISGVVGLDNAEHWHPQLASPSLQAHFGGGPGNRGGGLTPTQIRGIYDATSLFNGGITGTGQATGVFELSTYTLQDILQYISYYQLPWSGQFQAVNTATAALTTGKYGPLEVELDVELQLALAPKVAQFYIYDAPNNNVGTVGEFARIASDDLAKSVSTSWGLCEARLPLQLMQSENQSFEQMAAQGQSIYAASGDFGSHDCGPNQPSLGVDDPAAQPFVVGTGGTTLTSDPGHKHYPSYIPEVVWNVDHGPGIKDAGGGGISMVWPLQSWETGPGVINAFSSGTPCGANPGNYCREVPDVALNSDPNTGYSVYCTDTYPCKAKSGWLMEAGTSAAAPLWAAFNDLVNQVRAQHGLSTYRIANQSLYALAGSAAYATTFHDITQGNNCFPKKYCNCPQSNCYYPATPNYDLATGWGSLDMQQLLTTLTQALYVGADDGFMYQFDSADSGQGWRYQVGAPVNSSPTLANDSVYVGADDGYVYALNALNGALLWRYQTGGPVESSPTVVNGVLYVGSNDMSVYALNASTGALVWSYATGGAVTSSPTVVNGVVYIGSQDHNIYALDAAGGALLWQFLAGDQVNSSPAVVNGIVYVGSNDMSVYALNAAGGALVWSYATGGAVTSSPTLSNGLVYVGSNSNSLSALDANTGALVWSYQTGGPIASSPVVVNGIVYVGSHDGLLYALNSATGQLIWSTPTNSSADASPAVANGLLYEGLPNNTVAVLNAAGGTLLWSYQVGGSVTGKPLLALP